MRAEAAASLCLCVSRAARACVCVLRCVALRSVAASAPVYVAGYGYVCASLVDGVHDGCPSGCLCGAMGDIYAGAVTVRTAFGVFGDAGARVFVVHWNVSTPSGLWCVRAARRGAARLRARGVRPEVRGCAQGGV